MATAYATFTDRDTAHCAKLNDDCRWHRGDRSNHRHMMTMGVVALLVDDADGPTRIMRRAQLHAAIRNYPFKPSDGPERDFGGFTFMGAHLFFKIDAYDRDLEYGSPDLGDASVTVRVMTVMLASEY
jgi:Protein of unknown function (DUF3768)